MNILLCFFASKKFLLLFIESKSGKYKTKYMDNDKDHWDKGSIASEQNCKKMRAS